MAGAGAGRPPERPLRDAGTRRTQPGPGCGARLPEQSAPEIPRTDGA